MRIAILCSSDLVWATRAWEEAIETLNASGHEIVGLWEVTEKPKYGHSFLISFGPVTIFALATYAGEVILGRLLRGKALSLGGLCRRKGLRHHQTHTPNTSETAEQIRAGRPDVILAMTDHIINARLLQVPRIGILNKHASLLPANKGMLPYLWATIKGQPQGISYHLMNERIDGGPVIYQYSFPKGAFRSLIHFYQTVFDRFGNDLVAALDRLAKGQRDGASSLSPSYHSFPEPADVRAFHRADGRVITLRDFLPFSDLRRDATDPMRETNDV